MEKKKTSPKTPSKKKPAETSKEKFSRLTNSIDSLSSEIETLKLNIQKRKSENTTLKILFYTGLIVLLLGFLYTNATLQRAQIDSLESSIQTLRTMMNRELMSVERNVYKKFDRLELIAGKQSKTDLQEGLENMTLAISQLNPDNEKTAALIQQVTKYSRELSEAYSEQRKSVQVGQEQDAEKNLENFEVKTFGQD